MIVTGSLERQSEKFLRGYVCPMYMYALRTGLQRAQGTVLAAAQQNEALVLWNSLCHGHIESLSLPTQCFRFVLRLFFRAVTASFHRQRSNGLHSQCHPSRSLSTLGMFPWSTQPGIVECLDCWVHWETTDWKKIIIKSGFYIKSVLAGSQGFGLCHLELTFACLLKSQGTPVLPAPDRQICRISGHPEESLVQDSWVVVWNQILDKMHGQTPRELDHANPVPLQVGCGWWVRVCLQMNSKEPQLISKDTSHWMKLAGHVNFSGCVFEGCLKSLALVFPCLVALPTGHIPSEGCSIMFPVISLLWLGIYPPKNSFLVAVFGSQILVWPGKLRHSTSLRFQEKTKVFQTNLLGDARKVRDGEGIYGPQSCWHPHFGVVSSCPLRIFLLQNCRLHDHFSFVESCFPMFFMFVWSSLTAWGGGMARHFLTIRDKNIWRKAKGSRDCGRQYETVGSACTPKLIVVLWRSQVLVW